MPRAIVLGCGLVGAGMARDLAGDPEFDVAVADVSADNLTWLRDTMAAAGRADDLTTLQADLSDPALLRATVASHDIVIGAMPSRFGLQTLRTVIEAGKPFCDISFMAEDALELDPLAKKHGVTAVVDNGVAPGLSNMIVGHLAAGLKPVENVTIYVGGLPKERRWPYQYKAPFAPADVIEEYTRPSRLVENGRTVVRPALSEPELLDFPIVGTLEAFNTDGLRSLIRTIDCPNMKEKTLRYPGHIELMRAMRETGLFGTREIEVRGTAAGGPEGTRGMVKVRPLDLTSRLLFPKWTYQPGEREFTILRVIVEGRRGGKRERHTYDLYDETDPATGLSSMARTTGFPNVIVARQLMRGMFREAGVFAPEALGRAGMLDGVLAELRTRGVTVTSRIEGIES